MNNIYNNGTPANVGDSVAAIPGRLGVLAQVTIASIRPDGTAPVTLADEKCPPLVEFSDLVLPCVFKELS